MSLRVITDSGDVEIPNATTWRRQNDGSRIMLNDDGETVAEFDRENFVAVTRKEGDSE